MVTDGVNETPFATLFDQVNVNAPLAVKVAVLPKHVELVLLTTANVGAPELTFNIK